MKLQAPYKSTKVPVGGRFKFLREVFFKLLNLTLTLCGKVVPLSSRLECCPRSDMTITMRKNLKEYEEEMMISKVIEHYVAGSTLPFADQRHWVGFHQYRHPG